MDTSNDLLFSLENGYSIYQCQNNSLGGYFLCVPDDYVDSYEMFVSFPTRNLSSLTKEQVIQEIRDINSMIREISKSSLYLLPNFNLNELEEATRDNDDHLYEKLFEKLHSVTFDVHKKIKSDEVKKKSQYQVINVIKQTENDAKFTSWLEIKTSSFIHGINLEELKKSYYNKVTSKDGFDETKEIEESTENLSLLDQENRLTNSQSNTKVKKLVLPKNNSYGFNSIYFIVLTLIVLVIIGVIIGYLIIK